MGLVQQEWVGQSRGETPLPRKPPTGAAPTKPPTGAAPHASIGNRESSISCGSRGSGVPPRFSLNRAKMALPRLSPRT